MGKRLFPVELPDNLRCRRSDGRQWRCPQQAKSGLSFCEYHYYQVRRNQDSIKNTIVKEEASDEINNKGLLSAVRTLAKEKRRRRQMKGPHVWKQIGSEKMEKGEVDNGSSDQKLNMDLLSPDQLRHHQSDGRQWRCFQAVEHVLSCDSPNLRYKQLNEENAKIIKPKHKRRTHCVSNLLPWTKHLHQRPPKVEAPAEETVILARREEGEGDTVAAEPALTMDFPIPDTLRCRRSDGRKWRCAQPVLFGLSYCEYHMVRCKQSYNKNTKVKIANSDRVSHLDTDPQRCMKRRHWQFPRGEQRAKDLTWMDKNEEAMGPLKLSTPGLYLCDNDEKSKTAEPVAVSVDITEPSPPDVEAAEQMAPELTVSDKGLLCRAEDNKFKEASTKTKHKPQFSGDLQPSKKDLSLPDHLRCRRSDGRKWRCSQLSMPNVGFCEYHHLQMRLNQGKMKKKKLAAKRKRGLGLVGNPSSVSKRRQQRERGEFLGGEPTRSELKKCGERLNVSDLEVKRDLPNGVMAISSGTAWNQANAFPSVDRKLGSEDGYLLGRLFRSKNAERVPLAKVQKLPFFRGTGGRKKRICHRCRVLENKLAHRILCLSCQEFFCATCIEIWHSELSELEVKKSCPVCRGCCSCINCNSGRYNDGGSKVASCGYLSQFE